MHRASVFRRPCPVTAMESVRAMGNVMAKVAVVTRVELASGLAMGSEPVAESRP